jgi:hypothetical protein
VARENLMKTWIAVAAVTMTLSAAAPAQQSILPLGYADFVTEGIHWKFVSADRQARFGTVFTDGPTEFAPFFVTCRSAQGTLTFTLPQTVEPSQTGSVLRISLKGRSVDIRVTKVDSMGAPALRGTFELAQMGNMAQGSTEADIVEVSAGRWKMGYAARDFATAFADFRYACTGFRS